MHYSCAGYSHHLYEPVGFSTRCPVHVYEERGSFKSRELQMIKEGVAHRNKLSEHLVRVAANTEALEQTGNKNWS